MFDISIWIEELVKKIKTEFKDNLFFIGYQGSFRRGEATDDSDIDIVVILNKLSIEELAKYKNIINTMPKSEKACGFICGKQELQNWSKYELFQLYNDTKSVYGDIHQLIPQITQNDAVIAAKIGAENIYHFACHNFLYSNDCKQALKCLYKNIVFVVKAKYFAQNGEYILTKKEMCTRLCGMEKEILDIAVKPDIIDGFSPEQIEESYALLIDFCSGIINNTANKFD